MNGLKLDVNSTLKISSQWKVIKRSATISLFRFQLLPLMLALIFMISIEKILYPKRNLKVKKVMEKPLSMVKKKHISVAHRETLDME